MPSSVRLERIKSAILRRASQVVTQELKDPRLGLVTLTRVELKDDLRNATLFWSTFGDAGNRSRTEHALASARGHVQSLVAAILNTRVTPTLAFEYDDSVEGVINVSALLGKLNEERAALEAERAPEDDGEGDDVEDDDSEE